MLEKDRHCCSNIYKLDLAEAKNSIESKDRELDLLRRQNERLIEKLSDYEKKINSVIIENKNYRLEVERYLNYQLKSGNSIVIGNALCNQIAIKDNIVDEKDNFEGIAKKTTKFSLNNSEKKFQFPENIMKFVEYVEIKNEITCNDEGKRQYCEYNGEIRTNNVENYNDNIEIKPENVFLNEVSNNEVNKENNEIKISCLISKEIELQKNNKILKSEHDLLGKTQNNSRESESTFIK